MLGPLSFQPSEFVKLALVIHFAALLSKKQAVIKDFEKGFFPFILWTVIICFLIALQPNFSTMMVIFLIAISMMFIGNNNLLHLGATFAFGLVAGIVFFITAPYRLARLQAFLGFGDGAENTDVSYQLDQSLIALGNGGIFGVGVGQNRQSHMFLPESYGDFIFAIIGEEYGFIGLIGVIGVFMILFWRGMLIARKAPDNFGYFLAIGILITFAIYVFVNAGVNTGLLPTTGVPMPFVSYGGTAVFFYSAAIGILLNISAQAGIYPREHFSQPDEINEE
jgi:cell division protein FtsW